MPRGLGLIVYGGEGMGKTTFACQFPQPLTVFSIRETGFDDLYDVGLVPKECSNYNVPNYASLTQILSACTDKTIVIDSMSGFQQIFFEYLIQTLYEGNRTKFSSYSVGARQDAPIMLLPLEAMLTEKRNKGQNVILLCHTKNEIGVNPLGANFETLTPDMDKGIRGVFTKWAQAILFMNLEVNLQVATDTAWSEGKQVALSGKAHNSTPNRLIYTEKAVGHSAKNRLGLPQYIPMGKSGPEAFTNFWKHVPSVYKNQPS